MKSAFGLSLLLASTMLLAQANPVPFVNQPPVPTAVAPGGPSFTLTVNGTGFVSGSTVNWNGAAMATTFVSSSQLTATVPASDISAAGTALVTVVSPSPGGGASNVVFISVSGRSDLKFTSAPVSSGKVCDTYVCSNFIAADLNGDQKLDLTLNYLVPTHYYDDYTVLGNGDGTFETPVSVGNDFIFFAVADFNGDGKPDMVGVSDTLTAAPYSAYILLGNGDGTFSAAHFITSVTNMAINGGPPLIGDFNGDGKLDVAIAASEGLEVYLGSGDGIFQSELPPANFAYFFPNAVGDFNGDGKLDLVGLAGTQLGVYQGKGDGTFQNPASVSTIDGSTGEVFAVDLNGDKNLDLVTVAASNMSVLLGNGDGTFQIGGTYSIGGSIGAATMGDLDADGKIDVAASNSTSSVPSIAIMLGNGDGTFQNPRVLPTAANAGIVAGDFNNDGKLDLAVGTPNGVFLLLQDYVPDFSLAASSSTSLTVAPGQTANYTIGVAPGAGFTETVTLTCSGAPAESTCAVTPGSVTLDGVNTVTVSVAVATTASTTALTAPADVPSSRVKFSACLALVGLLGLVAFASLSARDHVCCPKLMCGFAIGWLFLVGSTMSGCGGNNSNNGNGGTQPGTYSLTITGNATSASTTLTHTTKLTLVVQ